MKKIILWISLIGLAFGLILWFFGMLGPFYRTEVVTLPINLQKHSLHQQTFTVDRTEKYLIEVHLKRVFPDDRMAEILGDYLVRGEGKINLSWRITTGDSLLAQGSNNEFGYSPIFGGDYWGLTIGAFNTEKGKEYTLLVRTNNESEDWNKAQPYVEVGLHPNKLEGYLGMQIFGGMLTVVFGFMLLVVAVITFISKRNKTSNK